MFEAKSYGLSLFSLILGGNAFIRNTLNLASDTARSGAVVPEYWFFLAQVSASR